MSVDYGMRQSLIEAGLVDPSSGGFLSEPNFGEAAASEPPRDPVPNEDEPAAQPQTDPSQKPASEPQVTPSQAAPGNAPLEQPDPKPPASLQADPQRLGDQSDPIRTSYEQGLSTLQQQAQMAMLYGRTLTNEEGKRVFSDEQLQGLIEQELKGQAQQLYLNAVMQRMQPVAKRAAAEQIAKEHGVTVEDIINEGSPVAMETRAKTIADLTRDGRFQRRKEAGTDSAEGSRSYSNAIPEGLDKLSPQQKIYAGLARGDR